MLPRSAGLVPVVLAIGYAALVIWIANLACFRFLVIWAAPVGEMAFTNYVTESIVLGFLFYGYGLGLIGKLGVVAGFGVVLGVYLAQVFVSRWWLQAHRFGPLEWLWRTLAYGKRQPWRRHRTVPSSARAEVPTYACRGEANSMAMLGSAPTLTPYRSARKPPGGSPS